jgi:FkbM family methyltransferase
MENQSIEVRLFEMLARLIEVPWMVDVGAHRGTMFLPFLQAGWKIHAFEPLPSNFEYLKEHFDLEGVTLHNEAVSSSSGTKLFHLAMSPDGKGLHEFYHSLEIIGDDEYHRKGETIQVSTVSLDDLVEEGRLPPKVGVIKIDTEGHDLEVLKGASRLTAEVVCVEFWCPNHPQGPSPAPPNEVIKLMEERDYPAHIVVEHDLKGTIRFKSSLDEVLPDAWGNLIFFRHKSGPFLNSWQWWTRQLQADLAAVNVGLVAKEEVIQSLVEGLDTVRAHEASLLAQLDSLLAQLDSLRSIGGAIKTLRTEILRILGAFRARFSR